MVAVFIVLIPAFITSQLKAAFEIGVLIYLPFFVIDLVTSNILLAMGMMMLPPVVISLPFKIMLFVFVDGCWVAVDVDGFAYYERVICPGDPDFIVMPAIPVAQVAKRPVDGLF